MKILYLCADRGIPVRGHKGAAVHVRTMTDAFARAGHTVTLLTPRPGPEDGPSLAAQLVTIPLPPSQVSRLDEILARDLQSQAYRSVLYKAALSLMKQQRFDFIYERHSLWSDAGARLAEATGMPLVLEVNAPLRLETARYRHLSNAPLAERIESTQFAAAEAIAVVSEPLRSYVIEQDATPNKVHVLPNGVDPINFHPAVRGGSVHNRYGLQDRIIVGFVGRPRPWHDLDTLLQAVGQLHASDDRYHFLLVGQVTDDLPAKVSLYGLAGAATLTGPIPHGDIPQHIAAMDVAVSPHLPQGDSYFSPLKLFEYLACGVPTVAADVGQSAQLIQDGVSGYLYRSGDADSLANRIRSLIENPAQAREIAWQGAVTVLTEHTWDRNAEKVVGWIQPRASMPGSGIETQLPLLDRKLRQRLYRATRPDLAKPLLAQRLPPFWKKGPERLQEVSGIEVLKYKPGRRCVLAYTLQGSDKNNAKRFERQIIGKVFRDERGRRLHNLQAMLWRHGFGPDAEDKIFVPRSLGFVPKMRMHLQERVPGKTLNELVAETDTKPLMPRAAQASAKLHNWSVPQPANGNGLVTMGTYDLKNELTNLDRFTTNLAQIRPQSMPQVASLRDALWRWAGELPPLVKLSPIHRDFYYSQLLFDDERVTIIDFDLFSLGDPAIDVANFNAHIYFMGLDLHSDWYALSEVAKTFLEAYAYFLPVNNAFWQRFAFYQAATLFRLLNVVASRPGLAHLFDTIYEHTVAELTMAMAA